MKGTPAMGKKSGKRNMIPCRRCGKRAFHVTRKECASCGYGKTKKMRSYSWKKKGK